MGSKSCCCNNKSDLYEIEVLAKSPKSSQDNFDSISSKKQLIVFKDSKKLNMLDEEFLKELEEVRKRLNEEKKTNPTEYAKKVTAIICIQKGIKQYLYDTNPQRHGPNPKQAFIIKDLPSNIKIHLTEYQLAHNSFYENNDDTIGTDNFNTNIGHTQFIQDGGCYIGTWYHNQRSGCGIYIWPSGAIYEGDWLLDKMHGLGRFIDQYGDIYEGEWHENKMNGKGIFKSIDGSTYSGDWLDDQQHGFGLEIWNDSAKYEGEMFRGSKSGHGNFSFANGNFYTGEFKDNNMNGIGVYMWIDGRVYNGSWKDGKKWGKGVFTWNDGRVYDGEYLDDEKSGYGKMTWPDAKRYEGYWQNGLQHGEGTFVDNYGVEKQGFFAGGVKIR